MPTITKYPQSAFVLQLLNGQRYAFDPGSETAGELMDFIEPVDAVFISHQHPDHFHLENLHRLSAPVYCPADVRRILAEKAPTLTTHLLSPGSTLTVGGLTVVPELCDHGPNISAPIDNLAFIIEADGARIYFAGDMAVPSPVSEVDADVVLLPVGSSKVFTPEEALSFAGRFRRAGVLIPIHYHGRADRAAGRVFRDLAAPKFAVSVLDVGESLDVPAA